MTKTQAQNLLNELAKSNEYVSTNYLDEAKLSIEELGDMEMAKVFAMIAVAQQLQELNWKLGKAINSNGVIEVRVVGSVTTYNGDSL